MKTIERADFGEVIDTFNNDHHSSASRRYAESILKAANDVYSGAWYVVELSPEEAGNMIVLVHHYHSADGKYFRGIELIPESGSTIAEVAAKYRNLGDTYRAENPGCYETIEYQKEADATPVFLSTKAIIGHGFAEHDKVQSSPGRLIDLDGKHRLIAWHLTGRDEPIVAYVAGEPNNEPQEG